MLPNCSTSITSLGMMAFLSKSLASFSFDLSKSISGLIFVITPTWESPGVGNSSVGVIHDRHYRGTNIKKGFLDEN